VGGPWQVLGVDDHAGVDEAWIVASGSQW